VAAGVADDVVVVEDEHDRLGGVLGERVDGEGEDGVAEVGAAVEGALRVGGDAGQDAADGGEQVRPHPARVVVAGSRETQADRRAAVVRQWTSAVVLP